MLIHKDCGGELREDWMIQYPYETEGGKKSTHPALICQRCDKEIIGDPEVFGGPEIEEMYERNDDEDHV